MEHISRRECLCESKQNMKISHHHWNWNALIDVHKYLPCSAVLYGSANRFS